jgi:hypothetical protein
LTSKDGAMHDAVCTERGKQISNLYLEVDGANPSRDTGSLAVGQYSAPQAMIVRGQRARQTRSTATSTSAFTAFGRTALESPNES